ncbi:hypothetical protein ACTFIW_012654 [Dictyostelium discoideum]
MTNTKKTKKDSEKTSSNGDRVITKKRHLSPSNIVKRAVGIVVKRKKNYVCYKGCGYITDRRYCLNRHVATCQVDTLVTYDPTVYHWSEYADFEKGHCKLCPKYDEKKISLKKYNLNTTLRFHIEYHHGGLRYKCKDCGINYFKNGYNGHISNNRCAAVVKSSIEKEHKKTK